MHHMRASAHVKNAPSNVGDGPREQKNGYVPPTGALNVQATPTAHPAASISELRDSFA